MIDVGAVIHVVDQRIIQRRGGRCVKFPVSCLIHDMLSKHVDVKASIILDTTYGQGRFYGAFKPAWLIGADVKVWDWVIQPDIFIPKPIWELENYVLPFTEMVNVVVVDPPFTRTRYKNRYPYSFYTANPTVLINYALKIVEALSNQEKRVLFLVHFKKRLKLKHRELECIEFKPFTRYLNTDNTTTYFQLFEVGDGVHVRRRGKK